MGLETLNRPKRVAESSRIIIHDEGFRIPTSPEEAQENSDGIIQSKWNYEADGGTFHTSEAIADLASERKLNGRQWNLTLTPVEWGYDADDGFSYPTEIEARAASYIYLSKLKPQEPGVLAYEAILKT
ncbi:MAG: hypothetical protein A2W22_04155 [Candidatus Levybacteria bacterium RBG_16_35_11]|nr:MAG: hypothetical protein A2W22_04155 [Candidatus Levybacteria bacterium RBG_16_35_11]